MICNHQVAGSIPVGGFYPGVVELGDTLDLGSSASAWGFDSPLPDWSSWKETEVIATCGRQEYLCYEHKNSYLGSSANTRGTSGE